MDNKQISDKLLEMAKFYQMTDEELMVIGKVVEMVRSADGDLISRKAVLELSKWDGREGLGSIIHAFDVERLQPVTPQQKVGRWIATENEEMEIDGYYCSNCDLPMETEEKTAYCPNCWARMVEPQESEVQE